MRKLRALWIRLRGLGSSLKTDEFNAELESHVQLHIEDNLRRGMTPEQARREALIKLGGIEQARQAPAAIFWIPPNAGRCRKIRLHGLQFLNSA